MNRLPPGTSFRACPSCGSGLSSGAITCRSCGGVVAVESLVGRLKVEIKHQISRLGKNLKDRAVLLWVLAAFPILILPPLLALFMSFRPPKTDDKAVSHNPDVLVLIVAVCNIVLSVMFWRWLGELSMSMGLSMGLILKSIGINHPGAALRSI